MKSCKMSITRASVFLLCFLFSLCMVGSALADVGGYAQTGVDRFNHSFDSALTGDPSYDIVTIALAQVNKTGSSLGYTGGNWCAAFVVDCAKYACASNAIPFISGRTHGVGGAGGYSYLYEIMLQRGASVVSTSSAKRGDIVFFGGSDGGNYSHVGIMVDNVNTVEGNLNGNGNFLNAKVLTSTRTRYNRVQILRPNYPDPKATVDVNGYLDGRLSGSLESFGTFDITVGSTSKNDVNDYCATHSLNTSYSITDIKANTGYDYVGVYSGSVSGKINTSGTIKVVLHFATQGNLHVQGNLDGVADDSLAEYGTFDVYINGELDAVNTASYNRKWPNGTTYEIRNISAVSGKNYSYDGITSFTGTIRSNTESKVVLPFSSYGTATPDWQVGKVVPGNLNRELLDIEYKYTYTQQARTSPGADWTMIQEGAVQYENDGAQYESDNELSTSATRVLVGYYYFHWCNNGAKANYYQKDYLPIKHTISMADAAANYSVQEKGTDGDGSGRKYYFLTHLNGQWAGGIAKCGTNGSQVYYRGGVYQNKRAYQVNTYQKSGDWTATYDATATSAMVRWRLKDEYIENYKGLQLNFVVDGQPVSSLDGIAGLDVFINGEQKASNATSFRSFFPGEFGYEIRLNHVTLGKLYKSIEGGDFVGFVDEDLKVLTLYFESGLEAGEDWQTIPADLLPYVDENSVIEYRHTYRQQGRTSPGDDWVLVEEGPVQYENDGAQYNSDNPLETSATRVLVGHYYFHWCDNGASTNANYYRKDYLPTYHTIPMSSLGDFTITEKGTDGDGSGRKWYQLIWKSGQWAGGVATCCTNGTGVYYQGNVYQNRKAYRINTYQKVGEWTSVLDPSAFSVEYQIRLKQYTITFDPNGGAFIMDDLVKYSGRDLILPPETPVLDLNTFVSWNTEIDGTGTVYQPGDVYDLNQDIVLHAQWKETSSLTLPADLLVIEEEAFAGINAIIIRVSNGCTEIQSKAFLNCPNLRRIYIPNSVNAVALDAFDGCLNLTICAPAGSTAIKVAKYNDIPYEEVEY